MSDPPELIGQSPAFLDTLAKASTLAGFDRPVLILGERGAGKELIAGRIHFLSKRWEAPLLKVNCAALSEELLDSELFGHEPGAFTGAARRHRGRFERAEGGTLFLDEIASASMRVQEKLLRVIEYGEYDRVGGETTLTADVRVVAAANADLRAEVACGRFRADLLDRLAFDVVSAPALRDRAEDIPLLATHFALRFARETGLPFEGFTPAALSAFLAHSWPGNVRELKNAAERSLYKWAAPGRTGPVGAADIDPFPQAATQSAPRPTSPPPPSEPPHDLKAALDSLERKWTEEALALCGGNQRKAAERLGLTYDQLRGVVRKHGLGAPA